MRTSRLVCAAVAAVWVGLLAAPAHATAGPAITGITIDSQACAGVCFHLAVDDPTAGTITLKLTGHRPGTADWVDTGVQHVTVTVVPGQTSYQDCFGDVSSLIAGKGFNSLRIEFVSSTLPNLNGTTTKSASFMCSGGSGGSGGSGSGSGSTSGSNSTTPTAALADTGGIDLRFALAGIVIMAAGLVLLVASFARRRGQRA